MQVNIIMVRKEIDIYQHRKINMLYKRVKEWSEENKWLGASDDRQMNED